MTLVAAPTHAALVAPPILTGAAAAHRWAERGFQGIPSLAVAANGRLWAAWYGGARDEGAENQVGLVTSGDGGSTWSTPVVVIAPTGALRAFDPALWCDPDGRLWLFWAQCAAPGERTIFDGVAGVWALCAADPRVAESQWDAPRRIADGIMMNKPVALPDGEWVFPTALWADCGGGTVPARLRSACGANVTVTRDHGVTFQLRGGVVATPRDFDEHQILALRDGRWWMLIRVLSGVAESFSSDGGRTWNAPRLTDLPVPNSRFHLRRLRSGRLLFVANQVDPAERGKPWPVRKDLSAWLSDDDGASWPHRLVLDAREMTSYPDVDEDADGRLWIVHDRDRYGSGDILLSCIREGDVLAGDCTSPDAFLARVIDRSGGVRR